MKAELYKSVIVARKHLAAIEICGEENVEHMAIAMQILKGITEFISSLPDEGQSE